MKPIIKLLTFVCFITGSGCFAQQAHDFPLKMEIAVDSLYTYPYKGLWFQEQFLQRNLLLPHERIYRIKVTISNTGKRPAFFYMMTCSKLEHLELDNQLIDFLFWGCDYNFLTRYTLKSKATETFYIDLIKNFDYYTNTDFMIKPRPGPTRLGLALLADIYDSDFLWSKEFRTNEIRKPVRFIWSNALDL